MTIATVRFLGFALVVGSVGVSMFGCSAGGDDDDKRESSSGDSTTDDGSGGNSVGDGDGDGDGDATGDGDGDSGSGGTQFGEGGDSNLGSGGDASGDPSECNDGMDNDDDGYTDFAFDPGCYGPGDHTETAGTREEEDGFTTWEFNPGSTIVYVSNTGDDGNTGSSPETSVKSLQRALDLVENDSNSYILLRRGDVWRDETLGRYKSGKSPNEPLVMASYGEAMVIPRIEVSSFFLNFDGQDRNYVQFFDLHIVSYPNDPEDPEFTGTAANLLRLVGIGSGLLIEGCHFEYGEILLQGLNDTYYEDVEIRASVVERAYEVGTCVEGNPEGNSDIRPQGIYADKVRNFTVEGNLFDYNGWNKEVDEACATIYNHNVYFGSVEGLNINSNIFARASSDHIKLRADTSGAMRDVLVSNNYFTEGEIGVSIGGNTQERGRFVNSEIVDNVFSDIGRTQPTTRTLAWAVDVEDNDGIRVANNLFLNQRTQGVNNSYALHLRGSANNVEVVNNLFYRIQARSLWAEEGGDGHEGVLVTNNEFVDPNQNATLIEHSGSMDGYTYTSNRYYSSRSGGWFRAGGSNLDLEGWVNASGEDGAEAISLPNYTDPERTLETYSAEIGLDESLEGFLAEARVQTRLRFFPELTATRLNAYVRDGFDRD
jgi:hypothetical protein